MQAGLFDNIPKFLNWFIGFIAKPLGIATWSILLILGGGYYGEIQRKKGNDDSKQHTKADSVRINKLETKVYDLSEKLANRDCSGEVEKYINLIQTLQIQTSQNKQEIQKRLDLQKQTTKELEKLDKSLNTR